MSECPQVSTDSLINDWEKIIIATPKALLEQRAVMGQFSTPKRSLKQSPELTQRCRKVSITSDMDGSPLIQKKLFKQISPVKGRPRVSSVCPSEITRRVIKTAGRRSTSQGARGRKSGKNARTTTTTLSGQLSIRDILRREKDKEGECVPENIPSSSVASTREVDDGFEN